MSDVLLAANGSAEGQFYIGLMYDQGKGFPQSSALGQALAQLRVLSQRFLIKRRPTTIAAKFFNRFARDMPTGILVEL